MLFHRSLLGSGGDGLSAPGSFGIATQAAWLRLLQGPRFPDFWAPVESSECRLLPLVAEPHAAPAHLRLESRDQTTLRCEVLEAPELLGCLWVDTSGHPAVVQSRLGSPHWAPMDAGGTQPPALCLLSA